MKRLLDVNTWIALTVETHPHHLPAREWYREADLEPGDLVFCRQTEMGLLRLLTQAAVMNRCGAEPLTNDEAADFLDSVYQDPAVSRAEEPEAARDLWIELARGPQAAPLRWMDAYLAAFAITLGAEMVTFDRGFLAYRSVGLELHVLTSL